MSYPFDIKKGKLHERLGIPEDQRIPRKRLVADYKRQRERLKHKAEHEEALEYFRQDQFALNASRFRHR